MVITLLMKEKEVKVDNIVFLRHNTAEKFTGEMEYQWHFWVLILQSEPVKQVMHRVRTVLKEQLKQRPILLQLLVHPC